MLFTVNDDTNLFNDYFNIGNDSNNLNNSNNYPNSTSDILTPKQGLNLGNLFASEYDRYKNYRPRELRANSEKESDLLEIRELAFAINDLNLKLDIEPNNMEYFNLFKEYAKELDERVRKYSSKYDVLELCYDLKNRYTWYQSPWQWEVSANV